MRFVVPIARIVMCCIVGALLLGQEHALAQSPQALEQIASHLKRLGCPVPGSSVNPVFQLKRPFEGSSSGGVSDNPLFLPDTPDDLRVPRAEWQLRAAQYKTRSRIAMFTAASELIKRKMSQAALADDDRTYWLSYLNVISELHQLLGRLEEHLTAPTGPAFAVAHCSLLDPRYYGKLALDPCMPC